LVNYNEDESIAKNNPVATFLILH